MLLPNKRLACLLLTVIYGQTHPCPVHPLPNPLKKKIKKNHSALEWNLGLEDRLNRGLETHNILLILTCG